jgi:small subunit ribosomal protein S13
MKKLFAKKKAFNIRTKEKIGSNKFFVKKVSKKFGINLRIKISFLKRKYKNSFKKYLLLSKKSKFLKKKINQSAASFLIKIKHFKGFRHKFKYPCRGQRTRTNAKTRKKNNF